MSSPDLGPVLDQALQHGGVAVVGGDVCGGLAVVVLGVDVAVAHRQQLRHHRHVANLTFKYFLVRHPNIFPALTPDRRGAAGSPCRGALTRAAPWLRARVWRARAADPS